jgi:prepilin-type processing-associated H-X9-DG protein
MTVAFLGVVTSFVAIPIRNAAEEARCANNLRTIGLALHGYHNSYNCFPPAYTTDARGKRLHSWRVLILPFAGQDALYREVSLDEPWNSPSNTKLLKQMPPFLACPTSVGGSRTSYAVVVGPETMFPGRGCVELRQITDGTINTVAVVETEGAGIPWMEPRDLNLIASTPIADMNAYAIKVVADIRRQGLADAKQHPRGSNYLFADGEVRPDRLELALDELFLLTRLTISGGEVITSCPY